MIVDLDLPSEQPVPRMRVTNSSSHNYRAITPSAHTTPPTTTIFFQPIHLAETSMMSPPERELKASGPSWRRESVDRIRCAKCHQKDITLFYGLVFFPLPSEKFQNPCIFLELVQGFFLDLVFFSLRRVSCYDLQVMTLVIISTSTAFTTWDLTGCHFQQQISTVHLSCPNSFTLYIHDNFGRYFLFYLLPPLPSLDFLKERIVLKGLPRGNQSFACIPKNIIISSSIFPVYLSF